jgi:hypothetical protein
MLFEGVNMSDNINYKKMWLNFYNNLEKKNCRDEYDIIFEKYKVDYKVCSLNDYIECNINDSNLYNMLLYDSFYVLKVNIGDLCVGMWFRGVKEKKFYYIKFYDDLPFVYGVEDGLDDNMIYEKNTYVVEGVKDCIILTNELRNRGKNVNVIGVMGNKLNSVEIEFFKMFKKILFVCDNDYGGKVLSNFLKSNKFRYVYSLGKDVGEWKGDYGMYINYLELSMNCLY